MCLTWLLLLWWRVRPWWGCFVCYVQYCMYYISWSIYNFATCHENNPRHKILWMMNLGYFWPRFQFFLRVCTFMFGSVQNGGSAQYSTTIGMEGEHSPDTDLRRFHQYFQEGDWFSSSCLEVRQMCQYILARLNVEISVLCGMTWDSFQSDWPFIKRGQAFQRQLRHNVRCTKSDMTGTLSAFICKLYWIPMRTFHHYRRNSNGSASLIKKWQSRKEKHFERNHSTAIDGQLGE